MRAQTVFGICLALAAGLATTACKGGGDKLVGKWDLAGMPGLPPSAKATFEAKSDKSFEIAVNLDQPPVGKIGISIIGDYTVAGDTYTMNAKDMKVDTSAIKDAAMKSMIEGQFKSTKQQQLDQMNKEKSWKPEWKSDDEFTSKMGTATGTFKRIK